MAVQRFAKACGLGHPEDTNEPLDHIATECELMEFLALRAYVPHALEQEQLVPEEKLPEGSAEAAYQAFFVEHIATWVPAFCEAVQEKSRIAFYRNAAQFLAALVAWNEKHLQA